MLAYFDIKSRIKGDAGRSILLFTVLFVWISKNNSKGSSEFNFDHIDTIYIKFSCFFL